MNLFERNPCFTILISTFIRSDKVVGVCKCSIASRTIDKCVVPYIERGNDDNVQLLDDIDADIRRAHLKDE
jgi:hypothetical protein